MGEKVQGGKVDRGKTKTGDGIKLLNWGMKQKEGESRTEGAQACVIKRQEGLRRSC